MEKSENTELGDHIDESLESASINKPRETKKPVNKKLILFIAAITIIIFSSILFTKNNSEINFPWTSDSDLKPDDRLLSLNNENPQEQSYEQDRVDIDPEVYEEILLEEAKNQNIGVNGKDIDNYIQNGLKAYEMSEEELVQNLENAGVTYDEYKEALKSQIMISELINENVDLENVEVSEQEVNNYIEANEDEFQDILSDGDESYAILRNRIQFKLLADKQTDLVMDYIDTLQ